MDATAEFSISTNSTDPLLIESSKALAIRLGITFSSINPEQIQLVQTKERLEIHTPELGNPIYVDFVEGVNAHRRKFGGGRGQALARAIGLKKGITPTIIDATAGLGKDAFVLASLGCPITMLERNPLLVAILKDGLNRAELDKDCHEICKRMQVFNIDSQSYFTQLQPAKAPEVIYLDPMYPIRSKSALVKKDMRLLHRLAGEDTDSKQILTIARQIARKRVVVKRPTSASFVGEFPPDTSIETKSTRYDIYLTHKTCNSK